MAWREEFYKAIHKWLSERPNQVIYVGTRSMWVKDIFDKISYIESVHFDAEIDQGGYSCCGGGNIDHYVEVYYCNKKDRHGEMFYFYHNPSDLMAQLDD